MRREVKMLAPLPRQSAKEEIEWRSDDACKKDGDQPGDHGAASFMPGTIHEHPNPERESR
jgi:hypothetical protein